MRLGMQSCSELSLPAHWPTAPACSLKKQMEEDGREGVMVHVLSDEASKLWGLHVVSYIFNHL